MPNIVEASANAGPGVLHSRAERLSHNPRRLQTQRLMERFCLRPVLAGVIASLHYGGGHD